jgi:nucleotide-binding universal stress UspA family protein
MQRQVMIAVDEWPGGRHPVEYVGRLYDLVPELHLVLFHVQPPIPPVLAEERGRDPRMLKRLRALQAGLRDQAERILGRAKEHLVRLGVPAEAVELKFQPRRVGLARDIMFEAEQGAYDAVVLGRRGLSRAAELFLGGVTSKVLMSGDKAPLWLVDNALEHVNRRFLVAVDGSENSLRAVDHVAFMLRADSQAEVTLLHVAPRFQNVCPVDFGDQPDPDLADIEVVFDQEEARCMADFEVKMYQVLKDGGFDPSRLTLKTVEKAAGVARTVVAEARQGDYGTIVIGRRGKTGAKEFFMGSVSQRILHRAEGRAVWVVA